MTEDQYIRERDASLEKIRQEHDAIEKKFNIRITSHPASPVYYEGDIEDIWAYFRDGQNEDYVPPRLYRAKRSDLQMFGLDLDAKKTYFVSPADMICQP